MKDKCPNCGFILGEALKKPDPLDYGPFLPIPKHNYRIIQIRNTPTNSVWCRVHSPMVSWIRSDIWVILRYGMKESTLAPDYSPWKIMDACTSASTFTAHKQHSGHKAIDLRFPDPKDVYHYTSPGVLGYTERAYQEFEEINWVQFMMMGNGVTKFVDYINKMEGKTRYSVKFLIWDGFRNRLYPIYRDDVGWKNIDGTEGKGGMKHKGHVHIGFSGR